MVSPKFENSQTHRFMMHLFLVPCSHDYTPWKTASHLDPSFGYNFELVNFTIFNQVILLFLLLRLLLHKLQTEWQEGVSKDQVRGVVLHSCCFSVYFASSSDFSQPLNKFIGRLCT